jgi:hypothetical protein
MSAAKSTASPQDSPDNLDGWSAVCLQRHAMLSVCIRHLRKLLSSWNCTVGEESQVEEHRAAAAASEHHLQAHTRQARALIITLATLQPG